MSQDYIKIKLKRLNKIKIFVVKKNDYNSLLSEVLKVFRQLGYNVKVEEK